MTSNTSIVFDGYEEIRGPSTSSPSSPRISHQISSIQAEDQDTDEPSGILPFLPSSSWNFKDMLQRHQGIVTGLQYLSRAGVMFIPNSFEFYEMAAEGCYSTSQLIQYFNSLILDDTIQRSKCIEDFMVIATRGIAHVEVLVEKIASALGGEYRRSQVVFYLELIKSACRLIM